ncbi:MAG: PIN domain-containing protein [Patescibacteria group bacterium]|mgnify:CR=1 FL=1
MTIDTNILIAYLSGDEKVINFLNSWRNQGGFLYLPTIVESELLSFTGWTEKEENLVKIFLQENFISISFDRRLAEIASQLRKTKKLKLPDAAIAATAIQTKTPLVTRNIKDFKNLNQLKLIEI